VRALHSDAVPSVVITTVAVTVIWTCYGGLSGRFRAAPAWTVVSIETLFDGNRCNVDPHMSRYIELPFWYYCF
jgi:hypothetical protein